MAKAFTPEELAALSALMCQRAQERVTPRNSSGVVILQLKVEGMEEAVKALERVRAKVAEVVAELERMNRLREVDTSPPAPLLMGERTGEGRQDNDGEAGAV